MVIFFGIIVEQGRPHGPPLQFWKGLRRAHHIDPLYPTMETARAFVEPQEKSSESKG
ncbi:hypothetical protein DsansV1_C28g0206251 [Dioscorea sansibarensis]